MRLTTDQIHQNYQNAVAEFNGQQVQKTLNPVRIISSPVRTYSNPTRTQTRIIDDVNMLRLAPSVFATRAYSETSSNYRFLPTISVINALRDGGYNVVMAGQSRSRLVIKDDAGNTIESKREFTKHIVRLRHNSVLNPVNVGDEVPEIVLVNSHDRTSSYKLMLGIFRLVCSNGMIVASETIESLNIRHSGTGDLLNQVIDVSARVINEAPKVMEQIHRFKEIALTPDEQKAFAIGAAEILPTSMELPPERLLLTRRYDDKPAADGTSSLWKTSNVIQENLIRGGLRATNASGRTMRTRSIKSVQANININKALWKLTEELAKLKA